MDLEYIDNWSLWLDFKILGAPSGSCSWARERVEPNLNYGQEKNRQAKFSPRSVVTGGAGFLGSHLVDYLLGRGHQGGGDWTILSPASVENIAHLAGNQDFKFIEQDVTEFLFLDGPVDYVWHFASPASPVDYLELPIQTLKVGSLGTHKALGLAKHKSARFLLASTSEIYGDPLVHPQTGGLLGQRQHHWAARVLR